MSTLLKICARGLALAGAFSAAHAQDLLDAPGRGYFEQAERFQTLDREIVIPPKHIIRKRYLEQHAVPSTKTLPKEQRAVDRVLLTYRAYKYGRTFWVMPDPFGEYRELQWELDQWALGTPEFPCTKAFDQPIELFGVPESKRAPIELLPPR